MSLVVVMNGPDAMAGLILSWFSTNGVMVPMREANITTAKRESDTVTANIDSPLITKIEQPKANIAAMVALIIATTNTF